MAAAKIARGNLFLLIVSIMARVSFGVGGQNL